MSKRIVFEKVALKQLKHWKEKDESIYKKIVVLISSLQKSPFEGIGKPEPLKHQKQGYWSRRINKEHRLVYKVTNDSVIVLSCQFHY